MVLDNQVAIVTGAGRGIGRSIARRFAAEGAKVALTARSKDQLQATAYEIVSVGGSCLVVPADITDKNAVEVMFRSVEETLGPVNLLVNNAGRFRASGPIWEMDPENWWGDILVNLLGTFLCTRAVVKGMVERRSGRIINLIGRGFDIPFPNGSGYAVSKAAVMRLTETLAAEARDFGVSVFAMAPGLVKTDLTDFHMQKENATELWPHVVQAFASGMNVPPTLGAELALELASGRYDKLTGRVFEITDDMDVVAEHAADICVQDLHTLRVKRWTDK